MKTCENRIADALLCECVEVWVTPMYKKEEYFPDQITIIAKGDQGFSLNATISNLITATVPSQCMKTKATGKP